MGNIDSKSTQDWGYIYIKTDREFYYPGNDLFGKVYIRVLPGKDTPLRFKDLSMRLKGYEKATFSTNKHSESDLYPWIRIK